MSRTPVSRPAPRDHEFFESGSPTDINDPPSTGLLGAGYAGLDIPDPRDHNFLFRDADRGVRYLLERGIADWHASETYQVGDIAQYAGAAIVCVAAPTVGLNPLTNFGLSSRYWEPWSYSPFGSKHTATDTTPIRQWRNAQSLPGNQIDRLGFFGGVDVQNWVENWRGAESQGSGTGTLEKTGIRWNVTAVITGGGGVTVSDPTTTLFARSALSQISTGASDECRLVSEPISCFADNIDAAIEGSFITGANIDLERIVVGLASDASEVYGLTNAFVGVALYKGNGDTTFKCVTGDGVALGSPVTSAVTVVASTRYLYRIEWIGSTASDNATRACRVYLQGGLIATLTATPPNGASGANPLPFSLVLAVKRDTGASARSVRFMPLRFGARTR